MSSRLNPQFRFESFVVGSGNRLAVTAARTVAESPGSVYTPLFLYADSGLGKTHLLMAIGHHALAVNPALSVEYLVLDEFVESWHAAVGAGQGDAARRRYASMDVLLLDDVQFLGTRRELQAEVLRLLDVLQAAGRQVVLASDRPPAELEALDERLVRRFGGGLVIDIGAPDYETRLAILRRRAAGREPALEEEALDAIARLDIDNVRELVGALNRVVAQQTVTEAPLDAGAVWALLGRRGAGGGGPAVLLADEPGDPGDEFGAFLSEVSTTLTRQVEQWRARLAEAVMRWDGEGYRTARLEALLDADPVADPSSALAEFERDVMALQRLEEEAVTLAPAVAGDPALRDPDDLAAAEGFLERVRQGSTPPPAPSPHWLLDDFVTTRALEVAVHAAREVAAGPGLRYNPLVLVGPAGAGKTHLLHGIGNLLPTAAGPVACLNAHDFVGELVEAIDRDRVAAWQARYRRVSALLLDDVHLLAGKDRTQEELYHLFNHLLEAGRQMVFTSAEPPEAIASLAPRLRTRMESGLVAAVPAPDRDLRRALVTRALAAHGLPPDEELAGYLAGRPADTARAVQGLVQRVLHAAEARQVHPGVALAREVMEGRAAPIRADRSTGGAVRPAGSGLRNGEKVLLRWPDYAGLLIEEYR